MSPLVIKMAIGMAALGITSVSILGTYERFNTKTIKEQLLKEKLEVLETEDEQAWQIKAKSNSSNTKAKSFIDRQKEESSNHETVVNESALKEACSKVMTKPNMNPDLEDARSFCTKSNNA